MLQDYQSPNKLGTDENMNFNSIVKKTPNDRKCSKMHNIMNNMVNENDMVFNEFQSTLFKTKVSNKKSTERQNNSIGNSTGTVRSFGVNLSNQQNLNNNSNNFHSHHYGSNYNDRRMYNQNNSAISMFYHNGTNNNNQNTFNLINNQLHTVNNNNIQNTMINNNNIISNNQDLNLSQHIKSVNIEFNKQKKRILSTEELLIEKIEKEKLEIEKLKKINKENIEKLFPNSTFGNYNSGYISNSINNQFNSSSILNNNNNFMNNNSFTNSSSLFNNSNVFNSTSTNFLTKKRDIYQQNNNGNYFTAFTNAIPNKKSNITTSNNELGIEEDYHSITDNISRLSVLNSPASDKHSSVFLEKDKEKAKKKEDKFKEIKKQSALSRMNFNIFEKNKF